MGIRKKAQNSCHTPPLLQYLCLSHACLVRFCFILLETDSASFISNQIMFFLQLATCDRAGLVHVFLPTSVHRTESRARKIQSAFRIHQASLTVFHYLDTSVSTL